MNVTDNVQYKLERYRDRLNYTKAQMAELMGTDVATLDSWIDGTNTQMPFAAWRKVLVALEIVQP